MSENGAARESNDVAAADATAAKDRALPLGMIRNHLGLIEHSVMTESDWEQRWRTGNDDAWHMGVVHPMLQKHYDDLVCGRDNRRVLVPMCGRTLDLNWLVDKGHSVVGVEFIEVGVVKFFNKNRLEYIVESVPHFPNARMYSSRDGKLKILNADFFAATKEALGTFDCIWDRGALVAMNPIYRDKYFRVISDLLADTGIWMLDSFDYTNRSFHGPPFVFNAEDIEKSLGSHYEAKQLDYFCNTAEKFKKWGLGDFYEMVHVLTKKRAIGIGLAEPTDGASTPKP